MLRATLRNAWRLVIFVVGATMLCFGLALLILPGPGIPVVLLGLVVLATEFVWARLWLRRVRVTTRRTARRARRWRWRWRWPGRGRAREGPRTTDRGH
jgi:tellurite resistance protein TerC